MSSNTEQARPLRVLIVGAGIGGLTVALALRRQGHEVLLFEKSTFASEIGAAISVAFNCNRLLRRLGVRAEEYGGVVAKSRTHYDGSGQHVIWSNSMILPGNDIDKNEVDYLVYRAHLHNSLKVAALSEDGVGQPVKLFLGSKMAELDKASSTLKLADGREFSGDFIIGADGAHSWTRQFIAPDAKIVPYGLVACRWLIPKATLLADENVREHIQQEGNFIEWETGNRKVIYYPFVNNELCNCVGIVPSSEMPAASSDGKATKETLLKTFQGFGPAPLAFMKHAPDEIMVWPLLDMSPLESWTDQRLALIGDACHPFTPFLGMGAAMAIEDAASLSVFLQRGTTADEVPSRLKLWQQCRQERVNKIQDWSRHNGLGDEDPLKHNPEETWHFLTDVMRHDEWETAQKLLAKNLSSENA